MGLGPRTLIDTLKQAAVSGKETVFLDQKEPTTLSYDALFEDAQIIAGKLQARGIEAGDRLVIVLPTGPAFAAVFWGIVLAGAVPCVLPSPALSRVPQTGVAKIEAIAQKIDGKLLITSQREAAVWGELVSGSPIVTIEALEAAVPSPLRDVGREPADLAVIQATSGSTSAPKCVMLSHENILANCGQMAERFETTRDDVVVCWLPMFHDMGLIGCFIYGLFCQLRLVMIPPSKFLRRPFTWVKAIHDYRGSQSPAPNFAYGYLLTRVRDEQMGVLDLSSWRSAICGAEPIDPLLLRSFLERYESANLKPTAIAPAYGMAEVSLCATLSHPSESLAYETICEATLHDQGGAVPVSPDGDVRVLTVCNSGRPVAGMRIEIRDSAQGALLEGGVGRIWLKGPSVMQGYLGDAEKTADTLVDGWLDSGDIGYMRQGCLFVLGRAKELIIIRGQNYYPTDFERAAEQVAGIEPGRVAAFGVYNRVVFSEELHLVCEVKKSQLDSDLAEQVKAHVARQTGLLPAGVSLRRRGAIPRTTSGKLQRNLLKQQYQIEKESIT